MSFNSRLGSVSHIYIPDRGPRTFPLVPRSFTESVAVAAFYIEVSFHLILIVLLIVRRLFIGLLPVLPETIVPCRLFVGH